MTNYEYCYARVCGMKSKLLDRQFFERLIESREVSEIGKCLEETVYGEDIHAGLMVAPGAGGIEEGLRLNLTTTFKKILDFLDGEARELVGILLERWDIQNIKTILRGKHVGASSGEIMGSMVPAGMLTENILASLAKEADIKAVIDLMATWDIEFSKPLTQNFSSYVTTQSLAGLELALDTYYYESALARSSRRSLQSTLINEIIRRQIDFSNAMTLLRLINEGTGEHAERFFIEGGKEMDREEYKRFARATTVEEVVEAIQSISHHNELSHSLEAYRSLSSLASIERNLEEQMTRKILKLFRAEPLSIAVIIAYLWAKVNEVVNIRIVLRAKEVNMAAPAIREALILV
jgi:V/A-type H+-transporting ATPase subunit C